MFEEEPLKLAEKYLRMLIDERLAGPLRSDTRIDVPGMGVDNPS